MNAFGITGCQALMDHKVVGLPMLSEQSRLKKSPLGHSDGVEGETGWVLDPTGGLTGWMAASSNLFLAEALGEFSLTSFSRPVCLSLPDPASYWGDQSQTTRGPADWAVIWGEGDIEFISHVDRGCGVGEGAPRVQGKPRVEQSCKEQLVWPWPEWPLELD